MRYLVKKPLIDGSGRYIVFECNDLKMSLLTMSDMINNRQRGVRYVFDDIIIDEIKEETDIILRVIKN